MNIFQMFKAMIFAIEMVKICWKYFCLYSCLHLVLLWVHAMLKPNIKQGSTLPLMLHLLNVVFLPLFYARISHVSRIWPFTNRLCYYWSGCFDYMLWPILFYFFSFLVVIFFKIFKNHQILSYIPIYNQKYRKNARSFLFLFFL